MADSAEGRDSQNFPPIDVAIITILDEEYKAILDRLSNPQRDLGSEKYPNPFGWILGEIPFALAEASYNVVLALVGRAGTVKGALATYETIKRWHPRYVFLVGIAGGFKRNGLDKGDVVLSDVIYGYEYGKIDKDSFEPRHDWTYPCDISLLNGARSFAITTNWVNGIKETRPDYHEKSPKMISGAIASGDKIIDNPEQEFFDTILRSWSRLQAVEMEGLGAAEAIASAKSSGDNVQFLMIRGISDLPRPRINAMSSSQSREREKWKIYAADAAAAFTISYIQSGLPTPPQGNKNKGHNSLDEAKLRSIRKIVTHGDSSVAAEKIEESTIITGSHNIINYSARERDSAYADYSFRINNFLNEYLGTPNRPVPFGGRDSDLKNL